MSSLGHRPQGGREYFVRPRPPSPILVAEFLAVGAWGLREPAGVARTMESPLSPGLSHRADEDWGEYQLRTCRCWPWGSSSFRPLLETGVGELCPGSQG